MSDEKTVTAPVLSRGVTLALAVAAGVAAANVWYNQPMLGAIARDFGVSDHAVSTIPTATQLGFACAILLLVPLGNRIDRRRLIVWQSLATVLALAAAALAPNLATLGVLSALVGAGGATAQQIVPFAAELAAPETRGRVVGTVMSGLLCGVLLARVVSGFVAEQYGWRSMCWVGAAIALVMAGGLRLILPRSRPTVRTSYAGLLASLIEITRRYGPLRRAALTQACIFATVSAFWSELALFLESSRFNLGPASAGLFGLVGVAGILMAPLAGRFADRHGPRGVIGASIALVVLSFVLFALWPTIPGLIVGVVVIDLGAQASMVANQTIIYGLAPEARGRLNTVLMTVMFAGGALGAAGAGLAWSLGGGAAHALIAWRWVCGFCLVVALAAATVHRLRRTVRAPASTNNAKLAATEKMP